MRFPLLPPEQELFVEAVAQRVVQLLDERQAAPPAPRLVDASELAEVLGVDRGWVYRHASELGAVKLGDGRAPRLRFDVEAARAAMGCSDSGSSLVESPCSEEPPEPIRGRAPRRLPDRMPHTGSVLAVRGKR